MANNMKTMQGCCCGPTVLCGEKTPGVGKVSLSLSRVWYTQANTALPASVAFADINFVVTSPDLKPTSNTNPTIIRILWSRNFDATDYLFGIDGLPRKYKVRPVVEVFNSAPTITLLNSNALVGGTFTVPTGSIWETYINAALGTANVRGVTAVASPYGDIPNFPFKSIPLPNAYYDWTGFPPTTEIDIQQAWEAQHPIEYQIGHHAPQGYMLMPSGLGVYDSIIYIGDYNAANVEPLGWSMGCGPTVVSEPMESFTATLSGVTISGAVNASASTIANNANGSYSVVQVLGMSHGPSFFGVRDYWYAYVTYDTPTFTSTISGGLSQINIRFTAKGRYGGLPAPGPPGSEATISIARRTPSLITLETALSTFSGIEQIDGLTSGGNPITYLRVINARDFIASALPICTTRLSNNATWIGGGTINVTDADFAVS